MLALLKAETPEDVANLKSNLKREDLTPALIALLKASTPEEIAALSAKEMPLQANETATDTTEPALPGEGNSDANHRTGFWARLHRGRRADKGNREVT